MNGPEDSDRRPIGYGRPPVATQFKKGQSGNPKGRPKGRKSVRKLFHDALHDKVSIREGDRIRAMTIIEAGIKVALNKMVKGDLRAFAKVMDIVAKLETSELLPSERDPSSSKTEAALAIEEVERRIARIQASREAAEENDAASSCDLKPEDS